MTHVARAALELFFFRVALKIRRGIGQLPQAELHEFLVHTLFKGGMGTIASILFVTFRATKCVFEHNLEKCEDTALSSNFICLFIILKWWMALVRSSIPLVMRRRVVLQMDRLVTMDVSKRQKTQLACLVVCGCCGIWLFAMMDNPKKNTDTVMIVGTVGCGAVATAVVLEARRVREVQSELQSTTVAVAEAAVQEQRLVSEASWLWIVMSGAMVVVTFALNVVYSIELGRWWIYGQILAPIGGTSLALAIFLKPRNETAFYKRFLYLHFAIFVFFREGAFFAGLFRRGIVTYAVECVLRICALSFLFWKGLALREVVAQVRVREAKRRAEKVRCQSSLILTRTEHFFVTPFARRSWTTDTSPSTSSRWSLEAGTISWCRSCSSASRQYLAWARSRRLSTSITTTAQTPLPRVPLFLTS